MIYKLKIIDDNKIIYDNILKTLLPEVTNYFKKSINYLKNNLPPIIKQAIQQSPEYNSLLDGQLKYEFGIPDSSQKLAGLVELWGSNIDIKYTLPAITNNQIKASFSISMIKVDFSDVLYSDYAIVYDSLRGYSLPWLEWLLLEGNKTIVSNQEVIISPNRFSRTGNAIMRNSSKSWKVPSQFAGTISDNWITRAIDSIENDINNTIEKALDQ